MTATLDPDSLKSDFTGDIGAKPGVSFENLSIVRASLGRTESDNKTTRLKNASEEEFMFTFKDPDALRRWIDAECDYRKANFGETRAELASELGKSNSWVSEVTAGRLRIHADDFMKLVLKLGSMPDFFMKQTKLDVVGKVGAGGHISTECETISEPLYSVNVDSIFIQSACAGFEVDGDSMFPTYRHGDIVVAKKDGNDIASLIGQDAVVAVEGEGRFLKRIERSGKENLFNLESYNAAPMREKKILWASRVLATLHGSSYKTI